ncbi:MAG: carboxylating nicotinate-nucleotide diphosphorylase [Gammaproteobacteria bacterium]|nr:carboxylating nicotinate-nucleotide diphosphorylase [Gammaproteobacteria bacterium]
MASDKQLRDIVALALREDIGSGDVTAALIPPATRARGTVTARETAVLCGQPWFDETYAQLDPLIKVSWQAKDGDDIRKDQVLCTVEGPAAALLTGERTALNFLQTLSGTATQTRRYVKRVSNLDITLLDTRKTLPGLRHAQKYAVACGGAKNHRLGLFDAILIKENHIIACGSIAKAIALARRSSPNMAIEVEVETLDEVREALAAEADMLLLDNFDVPHICKAVALTQGKAKLEVSGGITLDNIREFAGTGIDYISVGSLTKHVTAIDLSMRFEQTG